MNPLEEKAEVDVLERAEIVPEEVRDLITDGSIKTTVLEITDTHSLTPEQALLLENEIVLTLLMFFSVDSFTQRITESLEIEENTAELITHVVHTNIFEFVEDILQLVEQAKKERLASGAADTVLAQKMLQKEEIANLANSFAQKRTGGGTESIAPEETLVDSETSEGIPPMRTMDADMNRIHGYGAVEPSQENKDESVVQALSQEETFTPAPSVKSPAATEEVDSTQPPSADTTRW